MFQFQSLLRPEYKMIRESTRFLRRKGAKPGHIYALGSSLYYQFSGRAMAVTVPGFAWTFFLQEQWDRLLAELKEKPVPYIYVKREPGAHVAAHQPALYKHLTDNYRVLTSDAAGVWFRRVTP